MSNETAISLHTADEGASLPIRRLVLALGLLLVVCLAASLWWNAGPHHPVVPRAVVEGANPQALVTIKVRNAEVGDVLRSVAAQAGATPAIDPALVGKISIETHGAKLGDLMTDLCTAFTCQWELSKERRPVLTVKRSNQPPASLPPLPAS